MYVTGTNQNFISRVIALPTASGELVSFRNEGQSYAASLPPATEIQWNQIFAKSWAQVTQSVVYYNTGAF
jgi:hypothetical protein